MSESLKNISSYNVRTTNMPSSIHRLILQLLQFNKMAHRYHLHLNVRITGEEDTRGRNRDKMGSVRAVESARDRVETI